MRSDALYHEIGWNVSFLTLRVPRLQPLSDRIAHLLGDVAGAVIKADSHIVKRTEYGCKYVIFRQRSRIISVNSPASRYSYI